jgi:hypothetical protein
MIPRAKLDDIDEAVIQQLIDDEFRESRTLDFKEQLDLSDDGKKKLAEDVCAFANTVGGDLVFGLTAPDGTAGELRPVVVANLDEQLLRLTNFLRDALEPRISGSLSHHAVTLADGRGHVVVLRVGASPSAPHRVKRTNQFYLRHSGGKETMDIHAIRTAFAHAEGLTERARAFRDGRQAALRTGRRPVSMVPGPMLAVHLIPILSLTRPDQYTIEELKAAATHLQRARPTGYDLRPPATNLDGVVCASHIRESSHLYYAYAQLFRDGCVEILSAFTVDQPGDEGPIIFPPNYERPLIQQDLPAAFATLAKLGIPAPLYLSVSWLGVGGLRIAPRARMRPDSMHKLPAHVDEIDSPLVYVEDLGVAPATIAGEAIDVLWNAIGIDHSRTDFAERDQ